jgi:hypothetical protein
MLSGTCTATCGVQATGFGPGRQQPGFRVSAQVVVAKKFRSLMRWQQRRHILKCMAAGLSTTDNSCLVTGLLLQTGWQATAGLEMLF